MSNIELVSGRKQTKSGIMTRVSEEDYEDLNQWDWRLANYVVRYCNFEKRIIFMHLIIAKEMGILTSDVVDHKDRNVLNNHRDNLRPATKRQNNQNRGKSRRSSKYIGVSKLGNRWLVKVAGFPYGPFLDEVQAAKIRDSLAKAYYKEFAVLNFPE